MKYNWRVKLIKRNEGNVILHEELRRSKGKYEVSILITLKVLFAPPREVAENKRRLIFQFASREPERIATLKAKNNRKA